MMMRKLVWGFGEVEDDKEGDRKMKKTM